MEQITVDKQNCCVILLFRKQEGRFLCTHCGNWPLEQSQTQSRLWNAARRHTGRSNSHRPDQTGAPRQKAQTEFTPDWTASVRLHTRLYWKLFLRRRHNLQPDIVPLKRTGVYWYSAAQNASSRSHPIAWIGADETWAASACYRGPPSGRGPNMWQIFFSFSVALLLFVERTN